jgi:hypothetical protein
MVPNRSLQDSATGRVYAIEIISSKQGLATRYQLLFKNICINWDSTVFKGGFPRQSREFPVGRSLFYWLCSLVAIQYVFYCSVTIAALYGYLSIRFTVGVTLR